MASQNAMNGRNMGHKQPFMNSMNTLNRGRSPGTNYRPFSSSSVGSGSSGTPRIRDLSANTGYHFTGVSNQQPVNKRRRGGTPTSIGTGPSHSAMSPTTAFTLNQGPHRPLFNSSHRWTPKSADFWIVFIPMSTIMESGGNVILCVLLCSLNSVEA